MNQPSGLAQRPVIEILAIIHLDTSAGAIRVTVSEDEHGTLFAERAGSHLRHLFPVRLARRKRSRRSLNYQANKLLEEAIEDIGTFADIMNARQIYPT